jgi:hypothetical protein
MRKRGETQKNRAINPETNRAQNTTQKKYRVKNKNSPKTEKITKEKKQNINPKKYIYRGGEKGRGESRISPAIVFVPARKKKRH